MDFLDPVKQKRHARRLALGYTLIGLALLLGTVILLYKASGYGVDSEGRVIQSGLVFLASSPDGADVYYNKIHYRSQTDTRLGLPAGSYQVEIRLKGYHTWKRTINIDGGEVERFPYALLFPDKITTKTIKKYETSPLLTTSSPDQRWLIIQEVAPNQFGLFDLRDSAPIPKPLVLPAEVLAPGTTKAWQVVEWASDNRHVVLNRTYLKDGQDATEFILLDRQDPTQSVNLSVTLGLNPTELKLQKDSYDKYYVFDKNSAQLFTATLAEPTPKPLLDSVLAFDVVDDQILYATTKGAPVGKALFRIRQADKDYVLRSVPIDQQYLVALSNFKNYKLAAVGSQAEGKLFIYSDPLSQLSKDSHDPLAPVFISKLKGQSFVSISPTGRFVLDENSSHIVVYDTQTDAGYGYDLPVGLDAPQTHVNWFDDYHLDYVGNGQIGVMDFDGINYHALLAAKSSFRPVLDTSYRFFYTLTTDNKLVRVSLLAPTK